MPTVFLPSPNPVLSDGMIHFNMLPLPPGPEKHSVGGLLLSLQNTNSFTGLTVGQLRGEAAYLGKSIFFQRNGFVTHPKFLHIEKYNRLRQSLATFSQEMRPE